MISPCLALAAIFTSALLLAGCSDNDTGTQPSAVSSTATEPGSQSADRSESSAAVTDNNVPADNNSTGQVAESNGSSANSNAESAAATLSTAQLYAGVPLQVADISEQNYDDGSAIGITFSVPLDGSKNFQGYLLVERELDNSKREPVNGGWVLSDDGRTAYFERVEPDSRYWVTVDAGIRAINGETLHKPSRGDVTFGSLSASLAFASNGHFLPLNLHTGLPLYALNVSEANVAFHRVNPDKLVRLVNWKNRGQSESYYRLDELPQFSDLVHEGRFTLPAERNKRRQINLPLQDIPALREPGVYLAVMARPGRYDNQLAVTYFMVTDIGVHIRNYGNGFDVYLNTLGSPEPVEGAQVQLLNSNGSVAFEASSSAAGRVSVRRKIDYGQVLVVRKDESVSLVNLNTPALDLSDFRLADRPYSSAELFIYAPRDIYRGGETATFSALLRDDDGKSVNSRPLKGRIIRPDGQKVKDINWQPAAGGYYQYEYPLSADAQTGNWRLEVEGVSKNRVVYQFKVEDFMPERLKLTFNPGQNTTRYFTSRERLNIPVLGEYLYGAPAAGNRFDASIRVSPLAHPFEQWPDFHFGNVRETDWNQQFIENGAVLDKDGKITLQIDSRWDGAKSPLAVTVTGSLFESGGRPVVRRHVARVLPGNALVGIRPLFGDRAARNSQAEFELVKTNAKGEKLAADNLQVRLINQNRRYHWRYSSNRGWYVETSEREFNELTLIRSIRAGNTEKVSVPVSFGSYRLEITDKSTGLISSMTFDAGEDWYWYWEDAQDAEQGARPDNVVLALDKAAYAAGDVARLKIVPPAAGETLVLIESNQLLWSARVTTPAEGTTLDIPVDESWNRHDIYISALHLQPADNKQRITPTRSVGLMHLKLDREPRRLKIALDAPPKWTPNQRVVTEVKISDSHGAAVSNAWVTLAAVDVGVLSITDFKTPDPFAWFFSPRRYLVDMYDMYSHLIGLNNNRMATQRFGGDAPELSRGGKKARAEVQIVSLFSGQVAVKNGVARIPLQLPGFNGRLRLMALAFDDERFGSLEQDVTVAAPVVTQLSLPRFVAVGDETSVALDVTNLSGEQQALTLQFSLSGPAVVRDNTPLTQQLMLADGEKQTLLLPLRAEFPAGQIDIGLQLTGAGDYSLTQSWKLNSRAAHPALTKKKQMVLQPGERLVLDGSEMDGWIPQSLEALLSVNNRMNLNPRSQLEYLLRYPYGCLEQSLSSTYPWIYATPDQLADLGLKNSSGRKRESALDSGMDRIVKRQMSHGGYGLWSNHDDYEQHWLTAYAGDFLTDAQDEGVRVDADVLRKTLSRLQEYLRGRGNFSERWNDRPELYRQIYQSYAAYVLARHKKASLSDIRRLAGEARVDLPALPLLHLALAAKLQGDQQLSDQLMEKLKTVQREEHYYLGDYGSRVRDTAQVVRLLLQYRQQQSFALSRAEALARMLERRTYLSTQERNAVFMAAVQLDRVPGDEWRGELSMGSVLKTLQQAGEFNLLESGSSLRDGVTLSNTSSNPLFATLMYQGHSKLAPPAESNGVSIQRRYFTTDGQAIIPDDGALRMKVGELMLVQLEVKADKRRPDLLLVDLLPAGLELENQNLSASIKLDEINIDTQPVAEWQRRSRISHQEYRDDRYVAAMDADSYSTTRVFYLVRAVTPGNYQVPVPLVEDMYDPEIRALGTTPDILFVTQP